MANKSAYQEYEALTKELHKWHLTHDAKDCDKYPRFIDIMERIDELESNELTESEVTLGDRLTGYLSGYRDGKANNRKNIEMTKEVTDNPSALDKLALLQTHRHELYEQGFDDYSPDVEKLDNEIESLKGKLADFQQADSGVYECYLTGFLHARDRRSCDPDTVLYS